MKMMTALLIFVASTNSAFSSFGEEVTLCGTYRSTNRKEPLEPGYDWLGSSDRKGYWDKHYLKPRGDYQKKLLNSMVDGNDYCITGTSFWCGYDDGYFCMTVKQVEKHRSRNW